MVSPEPVDDEMSTSADARSFYAGPCPAARNCRFADDAGNLARATDRLASTVLYKARQGYDRAACGRMNRTGPPAWHDVPETGTLYRLSVTLACAGALARTDSLPLWDQASAVAAAALAGGVFARRSAIGSCHVRNRASARVACGDIPFSVRWTGWRGAPPALRRMPETVEPRIDQRTARSDAPKLPRERAVR